MESLLQDKCRKLDKIKDDLLYTMDLMADALDEEELLDQQLAVLTPRLHYARQWMVNALYYISTLEEDLEIWEAANAANQGGLLDQQLAVLAPRFHYARQWRVNALYYISTLEEDLEIWEAANAANQGGLSDHEASDAHT